MQVSEVLERARRMLIAPTAYWIGKGGKVDPEDGRSPAGEWIETLSELRELSPQERPRYEAAMREVGLDPQRSVQGPACDCSGLVCWALRLHRENSSPDGRWINTDWIWADARSPAPKLFAPVPAAELRPGALLVYRRPPDGRSDGPAELYGHVGIVTEVADGRARKVIHCAPQNFLDPRAPRNAVAETPPTLFERHAETIAVWCRRVQA